MKIPDIIEVAYKVIKAFEKIGILKVQGSQLDMPYLNQWARELSVSTLLKQALVEAGLL